MLDAQIYMLFGFSFVLGCVIGSFLNVCIYRIPAEQSIISPPSACPSCGQRIRWYQNVPLLSYLFLGGKCANCRTRIALRYPLVEALNGVLFLLVFYYFGLTLATPVYWLLAAALVVITFIDLDHQIIPDVISLPGIVIGFICSFLVPWLPWHESLIGIVLGGGILLLIAWIYELLTKREGMGGGDVKLLAMLGAFMGWKAIFPIIFLASLAGTIIGLPLILLRGEDTRFALPFGPFLATAALVYLFWGLAILHWYLSLFSS